MSEPFAPDSPPDQRMYVKRQNADGTWEFQQVRFDELDFSALFGGKTFSSTEATIGEGKITLTLDHDEDRLRPGCGVQMTSLVDTDCWNYGLIIAKRKTGGDDFHHVEIDLISILPSDKRGTFRWWELQVVDGPTANLETDTISVSTTEHTIGFGSKTFTIQEGKFYPEGATVLIRDLSTVADPTATGNYMFGEVLSVSGATMVVDVLNVFGSGTSSSWLIRLLDGPGALDNSGSEDWGSISDTAPGSPDGDEDYLYVYSAALTTDDYDLITAGSSTTGDYGAVV
jgi:hypothetical protein